MTLRIIHITDVYTLENFASLKNLIADKQLTQDGQTTISLLSGDFLMPYLLSSVDGGKGMMSMVNAAPIDYLTWGNHEKDLPHEQLMEREREYEGVWINTNMQSHDSFHNSTSQVDYDVISLRNGHHVRQIALLGILTDDPSLYRPGSFNGAVIEDPWETMRNYTNRLQGTVDLILPICHLYEAQDERTAAEFDFPLILGGHDHHAVDRLRHGTRILKPGSDAHFARVIDISWTGSAATEPVITSELLLVQDYEPDAYLQQLAEDAYRVLDPLRYTQLGHIPEDFRPLSSKGARSNRISIATFLATITRDALQVDACIVKGGHFRGERDYGDNEEFTLELLKSELGNSQVYITELPGSILRVGLRETWDQPNTGWFQHDAGLKVDEEGLVVSINGEALEPNRMYLIATLGDFFRSRDGPSIGTYYEEKPERIPKEGFGRVYDVILSHVAKQWWQLLFTQLDTDWNSSIDAAEFTSMDVNGSGDLDRQDVMDALEQVAGLQTYQGEYTLVDYVLAAAGGTNFNFTWGLPLVGLNAVHARNLSSVRATDLINGTSTVNCEIIN